MAGVDYVIMGAGIPVQVPGVLDRLAKHENVEYRLDVKGRVQEPVAKISLSPAELFPKVAQSIGRLSRPYFFPIVSSVVLAKSLIKRASGRVDGFVVEAPTAGGHNAPPRGPMRLSEQGEPIYGAKDSVDLGKMKELDLPFWVAGGEDSPENLAHALDAGASGIQVGTAFAYCDESGMERSLKDRVIRKVVDAQLRVRTDAKVSPTGFPFKVVELEGTLAEPEIYGERPRLCDIGLLRQIVRQDDGKLEYRCSAEPVANYVAKGGDAEDTEGRGCLCNNLCATAGFPQHRKSGYVEQPLITSGDGISGVAKYLKPGATSYTAKDVLEYLLAANVPASTGS